jgi:hypothetical protein
MKIDISKQYSGREVQTILDQIEDTARVVGEFHVKVTRFDGTIEEKVVKNIVTRYGLNRLANRAVLATTTSPFFILGVGTQTAAHSLDSAQGGVGEVSRKTSSVTGASAQSREWIFMTGTWAGFADSITSVALDSVFISDFPNSHASSGGFLNVANGLGVTLANSDFLALTGRVRVGSHDLSHST